MADQNYGGGQEGANLLYPCDLLGQGDDVSFNIGKISNGSPSKPRTIMVVGSCSGLDLSLVNYFSKHPGLVALCSAAKQGDISLTGINDLLEVLDESKIREVLTDSYVGTDVVASVGCPYPTTKNLSDSFFESFGVKTQSSYSGSSYVERPKLPRAPKRIGHTRPPKRTHIDLRMGR